MAAWFSKKPRLTPRSQFPPEIVRAIHTMADDMAGKEKPEVVSTERLVAFQPGQTGGAAFYTAPAIQEATVPENLPLPEASLEASPFLSDTSSPATAPTDPALSPLPQSSPLDEETVLLNQMRELEAATPVAVNRLAEEETAEVGAPEGGISLRERLWQYKKWIFLGFGIILCLSLAFFGWYWWQSRTEDAVPVISEGTVKEEPAPKLEIKVEEEKTPTLPHYITTQPNLLSFDTETVSANDITTEFLKIALSIKQDNLRQPVEFLVRDQKYNPLAFSRFAYLLGLNLPPEFLNTLDESFSLFFFLDGTEPRMGVRVTIKEKETFTSTLTTLESSLPKALEPFFLDKTTAPKSGLTFRSGVYQEQPVRFVNVDTAMNLSVDYAVRGNEWLIGTSQNTLRALLDRATRE